MESITTICTDGTSTSTMKIANDSIDLNFKSKEYVELESKISTLTSEVNYLKAKSETEYKLNKLNLNKDDILIMRIPTDDHGCIMYDYDEIVPYFNSVNKAIECDCIALPDKFGFEVMSKEDLKIYVESLQKEIKKYD